MYQSIGKAPSKELKVKAMEWAISGEIKLQDFFYVFGGVGNSKGGNIIALEFFKTRFADVHKLISNTGASMMDAMINCCCKNFNSQKHHDEIQEFLRSKSAELPQQQRTIEPLSLSEIVC